MNEKLLKSCRSICGGLACLLLASVAPLVSGDITRVEHDAEATVAEAVSNVETSTTSTPSTIITDSTYLAVAGIILAAFVMVGMYRYISSRGKQYKNIDENPVYFGQNNLNTMMNTPGEFIGIKTQEEEQASYIDRYNAMISDSNSENSHLRRGYSYDEKGSGLKEGGGQKTAGGRAIRNGKDDFSRSYDEYSSYDGSDSRGNLKDYDDYSGLSRGGSYGATSGSHHSHGGDSAGLDSYVDSNGDKLNEAHHVRSEYSNDQGVV